MKACEALEGMKNGLCVVAFEPGENMATEMFQLSTPDTIELYIPNLSDKPAHTMTPANFLTEYSEASFVAYTPR